MEKETFKEYILMCFMTYGTIITEVFYTLRKDRKYVSKVLCSLEKEGLISENKIAVTDRHKKYYIRYKSITVKGVEYVRTHYVTRHKWLGFLPLPVPKFTMTTTKNYNMLGRNLKSISAAIIFNQANVDVHNGATKSYYKGKSVNFFDMIDTAKNNYKIYCGYSLPENNTCKGVYFHSKDVASYFKQSDSDIAQNKFHQHIGVLILGNSSYFVYAAKPNGLKLKAESILRSKIYGERLFDTVKNNEGMRGHLKSAFVFTYTKKEFVKNFNALVKSKDVIEKVLSSVMLFPVRYESEWFIKYLIKCEYQIHGALEDALMKKMPDLNYGLSANPYSYESGFRLLYRGKPVVNGMLFDPIKLQYFYEEVVKNKEREYVLICQDWQKEYYEAVMPENVRYVLVGVNM